MAGNQGAGKERGLNSLWSLLFNLFLFFFFPPFWPHASSGPIAMLGIPILSLSGLISPENKPQSPVWVGQGAPWWVRESLALWGWGWGGRLASISRLPPESLFSTALVFCNLPLIPGSARHTGPQCFSAVLFSVGSQVKIPLLCQVPHSSLPQMCEYPGSALVSSLFLFAVPD